MAMRPVAVKPFGRNTRKRIERLIAMRYVWAALLVVFAAFQTASPAEAQRRPEQARNASAASAQPASRAAAQQTRATA
ncbi:hypothetical protein GXW77_21785, partial [Roseomonas alkaliterrae]